MSYDWRTDRQVELPMHLSCAALCTTILDSLLLVHIPSPLSIPDLWQRWCWCCCCCCRLTTLSDWLTLGTDEGNLIGYPRRRSIDRSQFPVQCMIYNVSATASTQRQCTTNPIASAILFAIKFAKSSSTRSARQRSQREAGQIDISTNDTSELLQKSNWSITEIRNMTEFLEQFQFRSQKATQWGVVVAKSPSVEDRNC